MCDPGLPDGPVYQPQAPAPQVKAGGPRRSPSGGSGGVPMGDWGAGGGGRMDVRAVV